MLRVGSRSCGIMGGKKLNELLIGGSGTGTRGAILLLPSEIERFYLQIVLARVYSIYTTIYIKVKFERLMVQSQKDISFLKTDIFFVTMLHFHAYKTFLN